MRILFIINDSDSTDVVRRSLSGMIENDSIYFVTTFEDAENFINKYTIGQQLPLDLIICDNYVAGRIAVEFRTTLVADNSRVYSNYDFNVYKIPVILLIKITENIDFYRKQGFSDILFNTGVDDMPKLVPKFQSVVRSWRKKVVDELDNLGIKFNSGIVDYSYYFSKVKRYISTNILSDNFQAFPRKLDYYWLNHNLRQIENAIDEFTILLSKTHRFNPKREEKLYHKFFNLNDFFLLRDNYSTKWYEQKLPLNNTESYQPDFSLKPNMNYETELNILEVKLPNEGFIKKTKFHATFYSKLVEHLTQIQNYKSYLEDKEYKKIIENKYGWYPKKIQYNLLMGRQEDKDDNLEILTKRMEQFGQSSIYLMTYDELQSYQVRYLDRMNMLKIY